MIDTVLQAHIYGMPESPQKRSRVRTPRRRLRRVRDDLLIRAAPPEDKPPQPENAVTGEVLPPLKTKTGRPFAIPGRADNPESYEGALRVLAGLGAIMATLKECAAVLGINESTLLRFFERCPEARDTWESAKDQGRSSLRRFQFDAAKKGNAAMNMFLGVNYLDQKRGDPNGQNVSATANASVTIVRFGPDEGKL